MVGVLVPHLTHPSSDKLNTKESASTEVEKKKEVEDGSTTTALTTSVSLDDDIHSQKTIRSTQSPLLKADTIFDLNPVVKDEMIKGCEPLVNEEKKEIEIVSDKPDTEMKEVEEKDEGKLDQSELDTEKNQEPKRNEDKELDSKLSQTVVTKKIGRPAGSVKRDPLESNFGMKHDCSSTGKRESRPPSRFREGEEELSDGLDMEENLQTLANKKISLGSENKEKKVVTVHERKKSWDI